MAFEERIAGRLAHRQGDTILNMVTLSHSLDIPKAEWSRNFSETGIISAECGFSARTYLYRSVPHFQIKRRLYSCRMAGENG